MLALTLSLLALAMLVAVASGAVKPKGGSYDGKTSQGEPMSFKVSGKKVKNPQFTLESGPCEGTFFFPGGSDKVDRKGKFSLSTSIAEFKGKFVSKNKAKGKATGSFQSCPGGTKTVGYTAKRR